MVTTSFNFTFPKEIPKIVNHIVELDDQNPSFRYILYVRPMTLHSQVWLYISHNKNIRFHGIYDKWTYRDSLIENRINHVAQELKTYAFSSSNQRILVF
jgi:hypothetical protein